MNFDFLEVTDREMIEDVFKFRYQVISETKIFHDYFIDNNFTDNKESDMYDDYSAHFVALNSENNICATVRLIYNSPLGYPTENCMVFDNTSFDRDKLGEISRIFIDKKYRDMKNTKIIIENLKKLLCSKMLKLGIKYSYGALEPRFIRLLDMYKMHYEIIGEKQLHGKMGLRYPAIMYTNQLLSDNPKCAKTLKENYVK